MRGNTCVLTHALFDVFLLQAQQLESDLRRQRHNLAPMERSLETNNTEWHSMKKAELW